MSTVVAKNLAVQNSAGTASTNISFDGTKLVSVALDNSITATANLHDLGVGQTWQDVTASRALGVTYTNSTGKPIEVMVNVGAANSGTLSIVLSDVTILSHTQNSNYPTRPFVSFIVPNGSTYRVNSSTAILTWSELR